MKNKRIKLFLWFFIAMLIEVCISHSLKIMGARPMMVYILIISVAVLEEDFISSAVITTAAAAVYAALGAQMFGVELVFYSVSAIAVFSFKSFPKYMHRTVKMCVYTALLSALHIMLMHFYHYAYINISTAVNMLVPGVAYNTVLALIIFPVFAKTVYKKDPKKRLLEI